MCPLPDSPDKGNTSIGTPLALVSVDHGTCYWLSWVPSPATFKPVPKSHSTDKTGYSYQCSFTMWPEFDQPVDDPQGSKYLGNGYLLLGPEDTSHYTPLLSKHAVITSFFSGTRMLKISIDRLFTSGDLSGSPLSRSQDLDGRN